MPKTCIECGNGIDPRGTRCRVCAKRTASKLMWGQRTEEEREEWGRLSSERQIGWRPSPETVERMRQAALRRYGNEGKADTIKVMAAEGRTHSEIATAMGVSKATVWAIATFGSWTAYNAYKARQRARRGTCG